MATLILIGVSSTKSLLDLLSTIISNHFFFFSPHFEFYKDKEMVRSICTSTDSKCDSPFVTDPTDPITLLLSYRLLFNLLSPSPFSVIPSCFLFVKEQPVHHTESVRWPAIPMWLFRILIMMLTPLSFPRETAFFPQLKYMAIALQSLYLLNWDNK